MLKTLTLLITAVNVSMALTPTFKLPRVLDCRWGGSQEADRIYTRIEYFDANHPLPAENKAVTVFDHDKDQPKEDEVAMGWVGSYYTARISSAEFHYDLWTCDTEDRFYSFKTSELMIDGDSKQMEKNVKGKLIVSVRDDESKYDLDCVAKY